MISRFFLGLVFFGLVTVSAHAGIVWGINGHPFTAYPGVSIRDQLDYVADLGMKSYRVNISNAEKGADLIALVKEAKKRGITILPTITPDLDLDQGTPKDLYDKAFKLAVDLVTPLKSDVRVWELGNEMENYALLHPCEKRDDGTQYPCNFGIAGGKGASDYYGPRWAKVSAVLKGLSDGVISVDPTIRKAMGTAGWGHTGAFERMAHDGIKWDISVWHGYGDDPEWAFKALARYGHPIWFTELNSPYGSQKGEQLQSDILRQEMLRLKELAGRYPLQAVFIYELMDETYWAPDSEAHMGLVHLVPHGGGWMPGDPKPAYLTVKQLIRDQLFFPTPSRDCNTREADRGDASNAGKVRYGYCLVFGEAPSAQDLASWTAQLDKQETSPMRMILALLGSEDFRQRYHSFALTNGDYLGLIYQLLLDRSPDGGGYGSYITQLNKGAMSRTDLAVGMVNSSEFKSKHAALFAKEITGKVQQGGKEGG